ncbi:MAG: D-3-phosphoglycerate dehydrogenase, partial [Alteromonas macleodii]
GHIGTQLSILAEHLGMRVQFFDIEDKLVLGNSAQVKSLEKLLNTSDVVSLHVPETPQTQDMIGEKELSQMKKGSILINASRGTVVDIDALAKALESGQLNGAAIDVFPVEPKSNTEEFESPLRAFDNVILTPHVGGSTQEAQENIGIEVAGKLAKYSDNGSTLSAVNFPEVSLPEHTGRSRLLHVHKNQPGILTQINQAFAEKGINIEAQYLQTNAEIGYVVVDVKEDRGYEALAELQQIDGTIKTRILH